MRVPNISIYSTATYQLGNLTSNLQDANEVMSTQKRINNIWDDPVGLSQVLNLKTSVKNLDQIDKNVAMGKTWLSNAETSLKSVNDLILSAKTEAANLANASTSINERKNAVERINGIIDQIVSLGNTQVNGNYIFSGTDTDNKPLEYNASDNTYGVSYQGSDNAFEVKTSENTNVKVGRVGSETFWEDKVDINSTNNTIVFQEDNGHGSASQKIITAVVPDGTYNTTELETSIRNALNQASSKEGYGVHYDVTYNDTDKKFSIQTDGSYNGFMRTQFMWKTGKDAYINHISTGNNINPDDLDLNVLNKDALTLGTPEPSATAPFRLEWDGTGHWLVENNPGYVMPAEIPGTASGVDIDLNESEFPDISMKLDKPAEKGDYVEFEIVPAQGDHSIGHEIGFNGNNTIYAPPVSDTKAAAVTDITITLGVNDKIDFTETNQAGATNSLTATVPPGNYTDMDTLAKAIETSMETASAAAASPNTIDYAVSYDPEISRFDIRENGASLKELDLNWKTGANAAASAGASLGYYPLDDKITYPESDTSTPGPLHFDSSNNVIDFRETNIDGTISDAENIEIPEGDYTNLNDVALKIQTGLSNASPNNVNYLVSYDSVSKKFMIQGSSSNIKGFDLLWKTGENTDKSAADMLGFDKTEDDSVSFSESDHDVVNIVIDSSNNAINFKETAPGDNGKSESNLTAYVKEKTYTSYADLGHEVEKALEAESKKNGNKVDYSVSWDSVTRKFTIKQKGTSLDKFDLQWHSGADAPVSEGGTGNSIGTILGFDSASDDTSISVKSTRPVQWGIFNTLMDFNQYLDNNDTDGIERTIGRLENNYNYITSNIVDTGMKSSRLAVRDSITKETNLSLTTRRSTIEDTDIIAATMKLQSLQTAYQASLASTSKIMNVSLVDYLT